MSKIKTTVLCAWIIAVTACSDDPTGPGFSGSFTLLPGQLPRVSVDTGCTITAESGSLIVNNQGSYTLRYQQAHQCSSGSSPIYGFEDFGSVTAVGTTLAFRSNNAQFGTYPGTRSGNEVSAELRSFGTVRFR